MQTDDVNTHTEKLDLRNCTHGQLEALLAELGQPKFRAKQVEDWVWVKNVTSLDQMTNLSKARRGGRSPGFAGRKPQVLAPLP